MTDEPERPVEPVDSFFASLEISSPKRIGLFFACGAVALGLSLLARTTSDIEPATHSTLVDIAAHRPWIPPLEAREQVLEGTFVVEVH